MELVIYLRACCTLDAHPVVTHHVRDDRDIR